MRDRLRKSRINQYSFPIASGLPSARGPLDTGLRPFASRVGMSSTNTQHEPTMEEILASIRKIISEDQPEPPKPAAAPPLRAVAHAPPPLAQAEEPDVLELTEEVHDEVVPAPPPPKAPAPVVAPRPPENDVVFESRDERKAEPPMTDHDLISDSTRDALGRSLANFDGAEAPRAAT